MSFSRLSSFYTHFRYNPSIPARFIRPTLAPISSQFSHNITSSTRKHAAPTAYEADKDYWSLKTTIDDIKAKYGLGGNRIKDPNLESNSDLDLEIDLTVADIKKLVKIQQLLEKAAHDLSLFVSASPPEIFNLDNHADDEQVTIKANVKKALWLVEDDDVSGYAKKAIKNFRENRVAGDVDLNAYTLEDGKEEKTPAGFQKDLYAQKL
ncbi:11768_t:CDS:1 [Acaulospora colombiana]|uniref:11768_t:CDS:1 n=1 Tax=Acaulospora colombiana TaxID=27376 RepID=A0ACA9LYQ0_9GLOM|nr:11768_t:CDS:1 [Acaulospora colombiana]